jgi:hypothetical protein
MSDVHTKVLPTYYPNTLLTLTTYIGTQIGYLSLPRMYRNRCGSGVSLDHLRTKDQTDIWNKEMVGKERVMCMS